MSTEQYVLRARILKIALHIFLLILVGIILFPVCWLVLNSLKTNQEMFLDSLAMPKQWMFVNYATAWGKGLVSYFANSIIVGVLSIGLILALSSMLAYGLTRFNLPGSGFIFILVLGGMQITKLAMGQTTSSLGVPIGVFYVVLPLCGVLNMLFTLMNILEICSGRHAEREAV